MKLGQKRTSVANIEVKLRSCVKFEGHETKTEGEDLVHLYAEKAHFFDRKLAKFSRNEIVKRYLEIRYEENCYARH